MSAVGSSSFPARSTYPVFGVGDILHWTINLTTTHPRGILCRRLEVQLFPAVPERENIRLSQESQEFLHLVAPVVAETPISSDLELGREYALTLPITQDFVDFGREIGHEVSMHALASYFLSLKCVPLLYADGSASQESTNQPDDLKLASTLLAKSEIFQLDPTHSHPSDEELTTNVQKAELIDITPLDELLPHEVACPVSGSRPRLPVRVGEGRATYDRDVLLMLLEMGEVPMSQHTSMLCPLLSPFERACLDIHRFHQLEKYTERELAGLGAQRACLRESAINKANVFTDVIVDTPMRLDSAAIEPVLFSLGQILLQIIHELALRLDELRTSYLDANEVQRCMMMLLFALWQLFTFSLQYYTVGQVMAWIKYFIPELDIFGSTLFAAVVDMGAILLFLVSFWTAVLTHPIASWIGMLMHPDGDATEGYVEQIRALKAPVRIGSAASLGTLRHQISQIDVKDEEDGNEEIDEVVTE